MSLQAGHKLAHYEIVEPIGKGGMGEVFRATDSKLGRDVALKVLPDEFAEDEERLRRFQREAKVLASLNHPNIAAIYGVEQSGDTHYLVLELVPGETLADRIARGPIPLEEALEIAKMIAEALEQAHEQGIVHRDLKPANVKLTEDGNIKVLDFGLAKAFAEEASETDSSLSPTLTRDATRVGVILGTAAYMSPEQAKGKRVDKRTDIFAFGALLYEMLTGTKAFPGEDVSEVLAAVIKLEPDWDALPAGLPPRLLELMSFCLEKDARKRRRDIGDVRNEIERALVVPDTDDHEPAPSPAPWPMLTLGVIAFAAIVFAAYAWNARPTVSKDVTRFAIALPDGEDFTYLGRRVVALSPDGTRIVYVANGHLNLRSLDRMDAVPVDGTDGARTPVFSPDGQWIAFWAGNAMRKVAITGGTPQVLCPTQQMTFGASWGAEDTIVYGQGPGGVWRVSADGGEPELLTAVNEGSRAYGPQMLPGGTQVLYTLVEGSDWDTGDIIVQSLETGERKVVVSGGSDGRYLPSGHLVYAVSSTLYALAFDVAKLETRGTPVPVVDGVGRSTVNTGAAQFSVSDAGSLAFVPDLDVSRSLVAFDRAGDMTVVLEDQGPVSRPRFSPDATRLAVLIVSVSSDVWILELQQKTLSRLTTDGGVQDGLVWSPDGEWMVFGAIRGDSSVDIFRRRTDFSEGADVPFQMQSDGNQYPVAYSHDGKWLVFREAKGGHLSLYALDGTDAQAEPHPLVVSPTFNRWTASLSPDGRFIAYVSDESGAGEVYVQPFPDGGSRRQISVGGGVFAVWSRDGKEIFYEAPTGIMSVDVTTVPDFAFEPPSLVVNLENNGNFILGGFNRNWDVSPDGQRFVLVRGEGPSGRAELNLVLNWFSELERLVPTH